MTQPAPPAPPEAGASRWRLPWRRPQPASRIGLWGAPVSGKTTMLGALRIAIDDRLSASDPDEDSWVIHGVGADSSRFLRRATEALQQRTFPVASTNVAQNVTLSLVKASRANPLVRAAFPSRRARRFDITLMDVAGRWYGPETIETSEPRPQEGDFANDDDEIVFGRMAETPADEFAERVLDEEDQINALVDHLARADGIVYLFDPTRELADGRPGSYMYLSSMLERVLGRAQELGRVRDGRLPQFLAVCITKIDDRAVFRRALNGGFVSTSVDGAGLPVIGDDEAEEFFEQLCSAGEGSDGPVLGALRRHFHPKRTRFFVCSSVGYFIGPSGFFRIQDFWNVEAGGTRIRGRVRPLNVVEPFLWLEESIRRHRPPAVIEPEARASAVADGDADGVPGDDGVGAPPAGWDEMPPLDVDDHGFPAAGFGAPRFDAPDLDDDAVGFGNRQNQPTADRPGAPRVGPWSEPEE